MSQRSMQGASGQTVNDAGRLFKAGRYAEAYRCCERILKREPGNALALWHIGRALIKLNEPRRAIPYLQKATEARPQAPEPPFDLGMAWLAAHHPEEAVASLRSATALSPDWPEAWSHLGNALGEAKRMDEAETVLRHALTLESYRAETLNHLGVVVKNLGRKDEAIEYFFQAIKLRPDSVHAWSNLGNVLKEQNRLDEALTAYRQALVIDPKNAAVKLNQGITMLLKGDMSKEAWLKYEFRWIALRDNPDRGFKQPLWRGEEELAGKSILLFAEQGLGDTIQFVRYAPLLAARGATVHLEVQPALKSLLAGFPGVASLTGKGDPLPSFDLQCPFLSLPFAMGTRLDSIPATIPYVQAPADRVPQWAARFPQTRALRVGVVWRGNPKHTNDANRSISFESFRRLFDIETCSFACLQVKLGEREASVVGAAPTCWNPAGDFSDFADTAAVVSQLDVVVAVDTSVAHLAAAMGKPVWVLLPFSPDWRWMLGREDSPWYPTMRLFRQPAIGDWESVVDTVSGELRRLAAASVR